MLMPYSLYLSCVTLSHHSIPQFTSRNFSAIPDFVCWGFSGSAPSPGDLHADVTIILLCIISKAPAEGVVLSFCRSAEVHFLPLENIARSFSATRLVSKIIRFL